MSEVEIEGPLQIKYRPQTLDQFYGNQEIVTSLKEIFSRPSKEQPHSFLLVGPSGCGKTTLARIIRKMAKCSDDSVTELNLSDFRGIDTIRQVREDMTFIPWSGDSKVYILDEAHKLTNEAQNALLKMLEDFPSHVWFVLCSTEPEKLLKTIRTRCTTFQVSPQHELVLRTFLKEKILKPEGKVVSDKVISEIARSSNGLIREAVKLLDQTINLSEKDALVLIKSAAEKEVKFFDILNALKNRNLKDKWSQVSKTLTALESQGTIDITTDTESIRMAFVTYFSNEILKSGAGEDDRYLKILELFLHPMLQPSGRGAFIAALYKACKI